LFAFIIAAVIAPVCVSVPAETTVRVPPTLDVPSAVAMRLVTRRVRIVWDVQNPHWSGDRDARSARMRDEAAGGTAVSCVHASCGGTLSSRRATDCLGL